MASCEIERCKDCPFFRSTEYSGIFCSYVPFVSGGTDNVGMESLIDVPVAGPPPDWCGLRRASVTISLDPSEEDRCPKGGNHEPTQKLTGVICDKCRTILDHMPRFMVPVEIDGHLAKHPGFCSPETCGHQPATVHVDCSDEWHKTPAPKAAFACPTCGAS